MLVGWLLTDQITRDRLHGQAVPFLFFLSLTANDSNLPGAGYGPSPSSSKKKGKGKGLNLRSLFSFLGEKKNQVMEQADPYASSVKLG